MSQHRNTWTPPWVSAAAGVTTALAAVIEWWLQPVNVGAVPVLAILGAAITTLVSLFQQRPLWSHLLRSLAWLCAGSWVTWVSAAGWTQANIIAFVVGSAALTVAAVAVAALPGPEVQPRRAETTAAPDKLAADARSPLVVRWEQHIRHITNKPVRVRDVEPWANPRDGQRVYVDLPAAMSWRALADPGFLETLAGSCRLPQGCAIRALEGEHQGSAVLDVSLRDSLEDEVMIEEDAAPTSIYDPFPVMTTPRGETLDVCLREDSMVVGGAPGSGKTTLLDRIIFRLARCVDALVWVVDLNGGGVAEPWISPWARGLAPRPVVDWVADSEEEAAVMLTVASAIAKDRKTSRQASQRKRAANTTVLPVDAKLPAIIVLTDEGGEVRQAASLLGAIVGQGISRLAQIGRAEAVRVVMSVLRGTSDMLDKGLRVNAATRLCLRMIEDDEYGYVLGMNPPRVRLAHKGSGYLLRAGDSRPIFGRTVNIRLSDMERHAIATANLRPDLDERAQRVAARIRTVDVLEGRDPTDWLDTPIMQDVEVGRAYAARWGRYAAKLAEMRGEEVEEVEPPARTVPAQPVVPKAETTAGVSSAMAAFMAATRQDKPAAQPEPARAAVDLADDAAVDAEARELLGGLETPKLTARDHIMAILRDMHPEMLAPAQLLAEMTSRGAKVTRTYLQDLLRELKSTGRVVQEREGGPYGLPPRG